MKKNHRADEREAVQKSFDPGDEITPPKSGTLVVAQNVTLQQKE